MQVVFTVQAEQDLEEIGDYIAIDNPHARLHLCERSASIEMDERLRYPGMPNVWWMPIQTRTEMLTNGIRSELLNVYQMDWNWLMERARVLRSERVLLFGLSLANRLLGTSLPQGILERIRFNPVIKSLILPVNEQLFCEVGRPLRALEKVVFQLKIMDYLSDRVRFIAAPTAYDMELLHLPTPLYFLYYLFRPIRLIWKFVLKPVRKA